MARGIVWNILDTDADLTLMSQVLRIKKVVAAVMANRGIRSKNAAIRYLRGLYSAETLDMKDAEKALKRIAQGIRQQERIIIYGDYDVDGVMSTVILYKALKMCAADVHYYIPHREEEGYGLNISAVRAIKEEDYDLLITCDNGIAALDEIAEARVLGIDVIVIDHHEPGFVEKVEKAKEASLSEMRQDIVPDAVAVVDPKQAACSYPFKEMCAAGLAFKLMESFFLHINRDFTPLHDELLALAAIATVCDIVELVSENRALVKRGLEILNANKNINSGLGRLIAFRGCEDKPIDTFTIGFVIGPCINATGRLESAEMSVRLLLSNNAEEQISLAKTLLELNEERKNLTKSCGDRILKNAEDIQDTVLVLVDEEAHESIAGIVAGRIKEALYRPVIVLTRGAEDTKRPGIKVLKGSGRSIKGYNMFEALYANRDLFLRFGGHAMAAGMSLEEENVQKLRKRLNEKCTLQESDLCETLEIDAELPVSEISLELAKELEFLAPFGKGNHEPLFVTRNLQVTALRIIDGKNTLIFTFDKIKGIAFGKNEIFLEELMAALGEQAYRRVVSGMTEDLIMDVVHTVEANTYNGRTSVQMRIRDFIIKG